ncbi:hypothetical protein ACFVTP_09005 [Streptomyces celluloflavus]|uniref:hypothetical protein n=1 Tax=Streptomyces celluloflavus TaxID=58344 RepID=UPI0036D9008B
MRAHQPAVQAFAAPVAELLGSLPRSERQPALLGTAGVQPVQVLLQQRPGICRAPLGGVGDRGRDREALDEVVTARLAGQEPPHAPALRSGPVMDLMAILQQSVGVAQEERGTDRGGTSRAKGPGPRRRTG